MARLALEWQAGMGSTGKADNQAWKAVLDSPMLPWSTESPWLCPWEAASHALRGGAGSRAAPHSALCSQSISRESRGAETTAQRKTSQTRIPSVSPGLAPASFQLQLLEQLLPLLPDSAGMEEPILAVRYIWLSSWDRERERGAIIFQMRHGLPVWDGLQDNSSDQRKNWSPEQKKVHPKESFSTAILGDRGKVKVWSTLKQKLSAGTKRSKTHILQRGQPAPQEMHSIWPNKSTQSS